ncbi:tissue inhibitor of metalloproteinase [Winogradskyella wandonensis]|uniref:Tissue inhibitor of metalloproteinase n=2 Tax=Winogradskyella wandonensis TaxID=1442586 RepID=A0A4R1KN56_9FLAO|nr:tissue inhibitor of metalloproteinase [Winogradskyella wandonensis]
MNDVKTEFKNSDIVLVGKVISKQEIDSEKGKINKFQVKVYRFYKGLNEKKTVAVYSPKGASSCGVNFEIGKVYILYGFEDGVFERYKTGKFAKSETYWTSRCHRNRKYSKQEISLIKKIATN